MGIHEKPQCLGLKFYVLISEDKEKPATDKPQYTPIRNLVIKRDNGMVHVEPLRKFKTLTEFFGYYQKNSGICKEVRY